MLKADIDDSIVSNEKKYLSLSNVFNDRILLNSDLKHVELCEKYIDCIFNKEIINRNSDDGITLLLPKKSTFKEIEMNKENSLLYEKKKISIKDEVYNHLINLVNKNNLHIKSFLMFIYGYVMHKYCDQRYIYSLYLGENEKFNEKDELNKFISFFPFLIDINDDDLLVDSIEQMKKYNLFLDQQQFIPNIDYLENSELKSINNIFKFRTNIKSCSQEEKKKQIFDNENEQINDNLLFDNKRYYSENSSFDTIFEIVEEKNQYEIVLSYNSIKFDDYMMENILECWRDRIYSGKRKQKLLYQFNSNQCPYFPGKFYSSEFSRISKSIPNETAVIFENKKITYEELDQMSNSLAHYLRKFGVKRNDVVPIICERTYLYIVAYLSVMKAGGTFVNINPKFPKERIEYIINDVKPKIILKYYHEGTTDLEEFKKMNINVYELDKHDYHHNKESINNISESNDTSYIFYTSGTTGNPKGVLISHDSLIHFCLYGHTQKGKKSLYEREYKNVLVFTQFTYAMIVVEILYTLLQGKTLIFSNEKEFNNPQLLSDLINKWNIEFIVSTPSRFDNYMNNANFRKALNNIKLISVAGESVSINFIKNLRKNTNAEIYVCFGLTETTAYATCSKIEDKDIKSDIISVGYPLCNYQIYILDKYFKPVPVGVIGEIYIVGYGMTKGYLNNEDLTNEKYIYHDISEGLKQVKLYKTGDKAKWTREGKIIHLGRIDSQLKIRGQRVEASEIENKIKEYDGIDNCVVINKKDKRNNEDYLICYYMCSNGMNFRDEDLKKFLLEKLPSYMVPNFYIRLEELPLSASGKLNRRALPEIDISKMAKKNYVMPETETEIVVCNIIQKIFNLGEKEVGKKSNLFEIGINSLNAFKILTLIKNHYKIKIGIKDVVEHPVIEEFSIFIDNVKSESENDEEIDIIKKVQSKYFPVTSQQLGIYIDFKKYPDATTYNIPISLRLKNDVNIDRLEKSIQFVFNNNPILKTKYMNYNELVNMKEIDLSGKESTNTNNEMTIENLDNKIYGVVDEKAELKIEHISSDKIKSFIRPFNLEEAPLIRVAIVDHSLLIIDIHHIVSDGTTIQVLIEQINEKYYGTENVLTENDIQYSDYACFINHKKGSKEYNEQFKIYEEMFSTIEYDIPEIPEKIMSNKESKNDLKGQASSYQKLIDEKLNEKINNYIKDNNLSRTSFFFSIYVYILSKYANQTNIYTSILSKNRNHLQCEKMVGMFVTTQPLLINVPSDASFNKFINENMKLLLNVYDNEYESLAGLTEKLNLKGLNNCFIYQPEEIFSSNKNANSIFKINQNNTIYSICNNISSEYDNPFTTFSIFDITFSIIERQSNYLISLEYNGGMYDPTTIERFVQSFEEVIHQIEKFGNIIKDIEYIPSDEKNKVIYEFNSDKYEYENVKCYHTEFEKKLDEMSNSLGHLLRMKNVERNDIIPIITDRSPSFIVSTLAISKAGGAFLPIDKNLPDDRILYILSEVSPKLVLCNCDISEIDIKIREKYSIYNVNQHDYNENITQLNNINEVQDKCYILFTSGTTGKPKGTILTHYNLYNYVKRYPIECNSLYSLMKTNNIQNVLGITNFTFDIYHNEITYSLCHGLTIVLVSQELSENIQELSQYIMKNSVDFINTTPTRFELFMENELFRKVISNIRAIIFIGEKLPYDLCNEIHKYSNSNIYNGYGPTECTVVCTYKLITDNNVTIGKPISNNFVYILDNELKPVPIG
ncbi:hypothetical protein PIROE2DRAFT_3966, partial [Piromyces sp. E2]